MNYYGTHSCYENMHEEKAMCHHSSNETESHPVMYVLASQTTTCVMTDSVVSPRTDTINITDGVSLTMKELLLVDPVNLELTEIAFPYHQIKRLTLELPKLVKTKVVL